MKLKDVMQEVADRLATIPGLRVKAHPADQVQPPAAVVSYPERYVYDATYGRGLDRIEALPIVIVVGKAYDRAARDKVSQYLDGSGSSSVKQVLESGTYSAFDTIRVTEVEFDAISIAAVEYLAATLIVDIAGRGST